MLDGCLFVYGWLFVCVWLCVCVCVWFCDGLPSVVGGHPTCTTSKRRSFLTTPCLRFEQVRCDANASTYAHRCTQLHHTHTHAHMHALSPSNTLLRHVVCWYLLRAPGWHQLHTGSQPLCVPHGVQRPWSMQSTQVHLRRGVTARGEGCISGKNCMRRVCFLEARLFP